MSLTAIYKLTGRAAARAEDGYNWWFYEPEGTSRFSSSFTLDGHEFEDFGRPVRLRVTVAAEEREPRSDPRPPKVESLKPWPVESRERPPDFGTHTRPVHGGYPG